MSALFKVVGATLIIILGITSSTTAQTKKQRKKPKVIQINSPAHIEYPADPGSPFYKMTVGLPEVDKVELFYISPRPKDQASQTQPYSVEMKEFPSWRNVGSQLQITRNILQGKAAEDFAAQWRKLLPGPGSGCFVPAYGIRFWAKDQLLLETEICYHCRNLTIPLDGRSEFHGFNAVGKSGKDLLVKLKELLPESDTGRNHN